VTDPTTVAGHRSARSARRLLLAALVALTALPLWSVPSAHAAGERARITLGSLSPAVATAGDDLHVTGTLDNRGTQDLRNVEVRLRLSDSRLNSRAELAAVMDGRITSRDGDVVASENLPDLDAGSSTAFDLSRSLDEIDSLTEFGVYVLGVEVLASRTSGFGRVAILRTVLPWVPEETDFSPTGFTWMWPLVSHPTRLADGTFADDSLATELEPEGRLDRLVDAGARMQQGAALTWVVDPELLAAIEDMADADEPYQVVSDGATTPGVGSDLAAQWLAKLRIATSGKPVLALPYGDTDITALNRVGMGGDLVRSLEQGNAVVAAALPSAVELTGVAWPFDGFTTRSTLAALRRTGITSAVLDGRAVPSTIDLSYTPSGRANIATGSGRVAGLLAEPALAEQLRRRGSDPLISAQRFLGETAMIAAELPNTGLDRTIVVMPPRRWDPTTEYLDRLADGAQAPWTAPVSLTDLADQEPPEVDRGPLRYPKAQRAAELPPAYLTAVRDTQSSINIFASILTDRSQMIPELERSVLLLESTWWRLRSSRVNWLAREVRYLADLRAGVRIQPASFTFSSRRGTIPLTVANDLAQEVVVRVLLDPQTIQLRVSNPVDPVRIGPRQKAQVQVDAVAVAGGQVLVDSSLHTPSGVAYGQPVPLRVSITDYGTVALYITVAAAGVLFLTAGVRVLRRVRAAGSGSPAGPADTSGAEPSDDDGDDLFPGMSDDPGDPR
jgi:hypothetical protein